MQNRELSNIPKVSIIVNCYNGEKYLKQCLDSIYAQSFTDWEIIFFDNNSSDRSSEIAKSYDERLRYYKNHETIPLGHARKEAVNMAYGEWIAFLDTDDYWFSNNLSTQINLLEKSDFILSYAGIQEICESGKIIRNYVPQKRGGYIFPLLLNQFDINMVTPLVRKKALLDYNLNFEPIITASEEYNLFMRLAAKGDVNVIPEILGVYRLSNNSLTNKQISKWGFEREFTIRQLVSENPGIDKKFPIEFKEATGRGRYYDARYQMFLGDTIAAQKTLREIKGYSFLYYFIYILSYSKYAWDLIHNTSLKRKITSLMSSKWH